MAFDINANKKILKRLSVADGGGFVNFASNINRAKTANNKILIIGSGGIGGKSVTKLKSEIYKRFEIPEGKEKPDNVEFLYLDSDTNELNNSCNKDINGISVSLGCTQTVHSFLVPLESYFIFCDVSYYKKTLLGNLEGRW